jgi:hypothetical protein
MNEHDSNLNLIVPALCLPDERRDWAAWLEKQLVGSELEKLVEQLVVLGGKHPPDITLQAWLAGDRSNILSRGLQKDIAQARIETLVRNPALLLELQELILLEGEAYWLRLPKSPAEQAFEKSVMQTVLAQIDSAPTASGTSAPGSLALSPLDNSSTTGFNTRDDQPVIRSSSAATATPKNRSTWFALGVIAATAAAIMVILFNPFAPPEKREFFAAAELQAPVATPQESLLRMASQVEKDWKPNLTDTKALQRQLVAFRDSCDLLIYGPLLESLKGLPNDKRDLVVNRCQAWKKTATELIDSLDAGGAVSEIQPKADEMIKKLTAKLMEIAQA